MKKKKYKEKKYFQCPINSTLDDKQDYLNRYLAGIYKIYDLTHIQFSQQLITYQTS